MAKRAMKAPAKRAARPRVVAAVGTAAAANFSGDSDRAARVEKAMAGAVAKALADGITDPKEQRALILKARDAELAR
jgi:hypothetical protein